MQQGAFSQRAALPPIISFGLSQDEHFRRSLKAAQLPSPLEAPTSGDRDLEFAAWTMCHRKLDLATLRKKSIKALTRLKHQWKPVTTHLRRKQEESLRNLTQASTRISGWINHRWAAFNLIINLSD